MSQRRFCERNEASWKTLERMLDTPGSPARSESAARLPSLLRRVSEHLAIARHRSYAAPLIARLNALALRGHSELYRDRGATGSRLLRLFTIEFPRAVRADGRLLLLGFVLLFGLGVGIAIAAQYWPDLPYAILGAEEIQSMERMHDPALRGSREVSADFAMFGFYVEHNVSIAFWCYALGMLLGLGTLYLLIVNGVIMGAVFGHMHRVGLGVPLESFAITHGAFELTGIMLAGLAGLKLGLAILAPGALTRRAAVRRAANDGMPIVAGATAMLVLAALLEATWSPLVTITPTTKFWVGGACWVLVAAFLGLAGRGRA